MEVVRTLIKIPLCCLFMVVIVVDDTVKLPKKINEYWEYRKYMSSPETHVDFETNTKYTKKIINHNKYKDYIYVFQNDKFVKARLMVNKHTQKMCYVINDKSIYDDIEKYKISQQKVTNETNVCDDVEKYKISSI